MPEQVFSPNIAWYLFLAGAGSGAYIIASFFRFAKNFSSNPNFHEYQSIAQGGFYLGPLIVLIGSLFLVFDLGSPQKAFLLLTTPRPTLLTAGTWFIVLFCITAAATLFMRADSGLAVPRLLDTLCGALSLLFAVAVMIYAGILFSSMSALPLLHTPAVVVLLVVSALATGSAVITLYGFLNQQRKSILFSMRIIPKLDISLIALEVLALLAVYFTTTTSITLNRHGAPLLLKVWNWRYCC
ncbi:hypothetical protein FACS1894104_5630 [Actinomycetota bacterium]|nr:hypothetical protein FACS1894104_5630 [Actinomycetota bacterium]